MNALEAGLFEIEHNMYLIDKYKPMALAAGYMRENVEQLDGPDLYFLCTAIMGAIRKEAQAHFTTITGCFIETDYVACLRNMSLRDLRAMRIRLNYLPLPKAGSYAAWSAAKEKAGQ